MRSNKKRNYGKEMITIFIFLTMIYAGFFMNLFFPSRAEVSELENRKLSEFPKMIQSDLVSGDYFVAIENYYADHFFRREDIVKWSYAVKAYRGYGGVDEVQLVSSGKEDLFVQSDVDKVKVPEQAIDDTMSLDDAGKEEQEPKVTEKRIVKQVSDLTGISKIYAKDEIDAFLEEEEQLVVVAEETEKGTEESSYIEEMTITEDQNLEGHKDNGVLIVQDTCYEIFGYSEKTCTYYANAINNFAASLEGDVQVYSLVVPSQIEFIKSKKYRDMAQSQAEAINFINDQFSQEVEPVNAYEPLAEHSSEYLYFRTDHHWTALGAYYAYTAYATKIGDQPYGLDSFSSYEVDGFLGTLYNKTLNAKVGANPDTVTVYEPFIENEYTIYTSGGATLKWDIINEAYGKISNKYMMFMSGDNPLAVIDTALENGKKALVFKDSYGNAFIPFLISHYDEIHVIDPRHYQKGAITYAKENEIDDVLFLNYAVVIAGHPGFAENIYRVSY